MEGTQLQIVCAAEKRIRSAGYHGFSFREVASDVGIKSSSVHHYFPTKESLGVAVARRYTEQFFSSLGTSAEPPQVLLRRAFLRAINSDGLVCLCGTLAAGSDSLPGPVAAEAKRFFERGIDFLVTPTDRKSSNRRHSWALQILALLEGAMVVSRALGDPGCFTKATEDLPLPPTAKRPAIPR